MELFKSGELRFRFGLGFAAAILTAVLAATIFAGSAPARSSFVDVTAVSGSAFGAQLSGVVNIGPTPTVTLPATGGGPLSASLASVNAPGVLTTGVLSVTTQGNVGAGGSAHSTATVANATVGASLITATSISSSCTSTATPASTGSTTLLNAVVNGVGQVSAPAANTTISIPGVATVVLKLFNACRPDRAYFGQKDAQQVAVVTRLARDLDTGVEIVACPTVREADGLAISSRNAYLSPGERKAASVLNRALRAADAAWTTGERDPGRLRWILHETLAAEPLAAVQYAEVVDPETFRPGLPLAVLAVRIGTTRLIDNHVLGMPFRV